MVAIAFSISAAEPFRRHGHQRRKQDHQEKHDQLCDHEGPNAFHYIFHADAGDSANDVEHDTYRRRDQSDRVVDDEQNPEIDRVDARLLDDRHQDGSQNQDGRRHVERGAHDDDQDHDREYQEHLASHEWANQIDDLSGDLGDGDQPG